MTAVWYLGKPEIPTRALLLSFAALAVPVVATFAFPDTASDYDVLLWLLALVPAFLLAYYRGWRGVATSLALGMALLTIAQVVLLYLGRGVGNWPLLLAVLSIYVAVALGVGMLSELIHRERARAEQMALSDELTGIANRRRARIFLETEFAAAERGRPLVVVIFDLDGFKRFNDRRGHAAGDEALRFVASTLVGTTRRMNLSARFGGEEFVSILSQCEVEGALVFIERVRAKLRESPFVGEPITVSVGVAAYRPDVESPDELIAAADRALYAAKGAGGDCVRIADRDLPAYSGRG